MLAGEQVGAVAEHIDELTEQLTRIVADGVAAGVFHSDDPAVSARAVFQATGRFHDPAYAGEWVGPRADADFAAVVELLLRGLRA